jgi:hypothetical protein
MPLPCTTPTPAVPANTFPAPNPVNRQDPASRPTSWHWIPTAVLQSNHSLKRADSIELARARMASLRGEKTKADEAIAELDAALAPHELRSFVGNMVQFYEKLTARVAELDKSKP